MKQILCLNYNTILLLILTCSYKVSFLTRDKINFRCINFISFSFFFFCLFFLFSRIFTKRSSSKDCSYYGNNFYNIEALIFLRCKLPKNCCEEGQLERIQEGKDKGLDNRLYILSFLTALRRIKFLHSIGISKIVYST